MRHLLYAREHLLRTDGADVDAELLGFRQKRPVAVHGKKSRAQRLRALFRYSRWSRKWPRHSQERRLRQLDQSARAVLRRELARGRRIGQLRVPRRACELQQDLKAVSRLEPLR